ncbi:hypothetical protein [Vibrio diabolicus]|uniref:hypothetical protein n=1 Tax=Vibrio diabolicus TaxID=50719 RepID=UPI00215E8799|nr:hypothetical protein [Vibrio diabolicus]MCS0379749.1 hypothetical protein [Vibrio diabolicus]MCS0421698.1 hypothetical protein [Vibrio diabolicus]
MKSAIIICLLFTFSFSLQAKELYRAPSAGDSGAYYVLKQSKQTDGTIKVLTSRVGKGKAYTDFTELKINCKKRLYFTLAGSSEEGAKSKPSKPLKDWSKNSKWTSLVNGSSKSDLVYYVCR